MAKHRQVNFRLDELIFESAKAMGLNVSEICREAINKEIKERSNHAISYTKRENEEKTNGVIALNG